jgi:hypothetical protein
MVAQLRARCDEVESGEIGETDRLGAPIEDLEVVNLFPLGGFKPVWSSVRYGLLRGVC